MSDFPLPFLNGALITIMGSYLNSGDPRVADLGSHPKSRSARVPGADVVRMAREFPVRASLSGPAAGVQGALRRSIAADLKTSSRSMSAEQAPMWR